MHAGRGHGCSPSWQVCTLPPSRGCQPGRGCCGGGVRAGCGTSRGAGGRCAPPRAPSCRQTRSYGKHMAGNPVPDGYLLHFPGPWWVCAAPAHAAGPPRGTAPKAPLGARHGRAGQGAGGTARRPRAAVQKCPAERRQRRSGTSAVSCARALHAWSQLSTPLLPSRARLNAGFRKAKSS